MILSDRSIKDLILNHKLNIINPFNPLDLQPNSYDMHLDNQLMDLHGKRIDIKEQSYKLKPNESAPVISS